MNEKVLFVDDDVSILGSFNRQLRKYFAIETASSGEKGLEILQTKGPFAVTVADMQMPAMNGVQYLAKARAITPNTVRMILTGYADLTTAIDAVNDGNIYRFLNKPITEEKLIKAVNDGIDQYHLITAEKELLEKTLSRTIGVLIDMLTLINPAAFSRATRIRAHVRQIVAILHLENAWQYDLAALLSQIGCITLPPGLSDKLYDGLPLSPGEETMIAGHPRTGARLLEKIPRLENIAQMIELQQRPYSDYSLTVYDPQRKLINIGAQILKIALDYEDLLHRGLQAQAALNILLIKPEDYNPDIVKIVELELLTEKPEAITHRINLKQVAIGMVAMQDIRTKHGLLLLSKGQEFTLPTIERLRNFYDASGIDEPFLVMIPAESQSQ